MVNKGILDGDIIVVHEQHDAQNRDVVVALIDDSATVKTFYREDEYIRLQPENDAMEPIYVKSPVIDLVNLVDQLSLGHIEAKGHDGYGFETDTRSSNR